MRTPWLIAGFCGYLLSGCSSETGNPPPISSSGGSGNETGVGATAATDGLTGTGGYATGGYGFWSGGAGATAGGGTGPVGGGVSTGGFGTGGVGNPGAGGLSTGGFAPATGGMPAGGALPTGGAPPAGGNTPTGGASPAGGNAPTGGAPPAGGNAPTGGAPPAGGGFPTGGAAPTGGADNTGGAPPTGGADNTGGSGGGTTFDCGDIPEPATLNTASVTAGSLKILNWAGFKGAVTFSFDDNTQSTINAYNDMSGTGVRFTFYLWTGQSSFNNEVWGKWRDAGSELGNHTSTHAQNNPSGVDEGAAAIKSTWGVTPYTFAAPYGENYTSLVQGKYLLNRAAGGCTAIKPNDTSNIWSLPSCLPNSSGDVGTQVGTARSQGGWIFFCIHGFASPDYQPIDQGGFISAVNSAKQAGDVWLDTADRIGAYYVGQKLLAQAASGGSGTISWTLPGGFPPNRCLRVTVDSGSIQQNGQAVAKSAKGYYEISLDAKSLTISP